MYCNGKRVVSAGYDPISGQQFPVLQTSGGNSGDMWKFGVVSVANGTTDKQSPRCKHPLAKGAVCIKWPEDANFDEQEHFSWSILTRENWNKEAVLGWRYTASQLAKLGATYRPSGKRPRGGA